jgi:hypothetical protein
MKTSLALTIVRGLLALLLLGFGGCAGGSGSDSAGGGIGGTGVTVGAVTAIGSVVVNGVDFDTTTAVVFVGGVNEGAGDQAVRDHLRVGMVVVVEGAVANNEVAGTATGVYFEADVAGSVASIHPGTGQIIVLGQVVVIDEGTVLDGYAIFSDIRPGDPVEVSGLASVVSGEDAIRATYVAKKSAITEVEVKGLVRDLDSLTRTFKIGNLTVRYDAMTELPDGEPTDGLHVRVVGSVGRAGELDATIVELAKEAKVANGETMDVEGYVTEVVSPSEFSVGYQQVRTDDKTTFHGGGPANIKPGVKLEVKGKLQDQVLTAQKITFD